MRKAPVSADVDLPRPTISARVLLHAECLWLLPLFDVAPGILAAEQARLSAAGFAPDYLALVVAESLEVLETSDPTKPMRLLAAAKLGTVRLLDNQAVFADT